MALKCLEIFRFDREALGLPEADRRALAEKMTIVKNDFQENELAWQAEIGWFDEMLVVGFLTVVMAAPMLIGPSFFLCAFAGLKPLMGWFLIMGTLAYHPWPTASKAAWQWRLTRALYKYFSYRIVWVGDSREKATDSRTWIGAGPPHGVMPFANVLSIPMINTFIRPFRGAGANVTARTPFLRYLTTFGFVDASAQSIVDKLNEGFCVGLVPDGIAGIFAYHGNDEIVAMKHRKGIAKLALKHGITILPAYSVGNTAIYTPVFDKWGLCEKISRRMRASVFVFYGRFFLPIPRRVNITLLIGDPIIVDKVDHGEPTQDQIDAVHAQLLNQLESSFNRHKAALGWAHKSVVFK